MDACLTNAYNALIKKNMIYDIDSLPIEHPDWFDAMLYKYYIEIDNEIEIKNFYKWMYKDRNRYGFLKYFINIMTDKIKLVFLASMIAYSNGSEQS